MACPGPRHLDALRGVLAHLAPRDERGAHVPGGAAEGRAVDGELDERVVELAVEAGGDHAAAQTDVFGDGVGRAEGREQPRGALGLLALHDELAAHVGLHLGPVDPQQHAQAAIEGQAARVEADQVDAAHVAEDLPGDAGRPGSVEEGLAAGLRGHADQRVLGQAYVPVGVGHRRAPGRRGHQRRRRHPLGLHRVEPHAVGVGLVDGAVEGVHPEEGVGFDGGKKARGGGRLALGRAEEGQVVLAGFRAQPVGEVEHRLGLGQLGHAAQGHREAGEGALDAPGFLHLVTPGGGQGSGETGRPVVREEELYDLPHPVLLEGGLGHPLLGVGLDAVDALEQGLVVAGQLGHPHQVPTVGEDHGAVVAPDQPGDQAAGDLHGVHPAGEGQELLVDVEQVGRPRRRRGHGRWRRGGRLGRQLFDHGRRGAVGLRRRADPVDEELLDRAAGDDQLEILPGQRGDGLLGTGDGHVELDQAPLDPLGQPDVTGTIGVGLVGALCRGHGPGEGHDRQRGGLKGAHHCGRLSPFGNVGARSGSERGCRPLAGAGQEAIDPAAGGMER